MKRTTEKKRVTEGIGTVREGVIILNKVIKAGHIEKMTSELRTQRRGNGVTAMEGRVFWLKGKASARH